ncbi:hypothetical protein [Spirillospora sp. NPDC047279]|uniref:hypothetical protein n=1 Tax=Spirillospora sp. NPDC047279 TaxID=3155478 RepID=UPI0033C58FED
MTVPAYDYDAPLADERDDWKRGGLHFHCYMARMTSDSYGNEGQRRDLSSPLPPRVIREWLQKPQSALLLTPATPEDAVDWLRTQWQPHGDRDEAHYARALHDLRCGNDVLWGEWINAASQHLHTAIVGTNQGCH